MLLFVFSGRSWAPTGKRSTLDREKQRELYRILQVLSKHLKSILIIKIRSFTLDSKVWRAESLPLYHGTCLVARCGEQRACLCYYGTFLKQDVVSREPAIVIMVHVRYQGVASDSLPLLSWYMLGSKVWRTESLSLLSWYMLGSKVW